MSRLFEWQWIQDHQAHYQQDPEAAHDWDASATGNPGIVPTLLLHTLGRKSGTWRASPLLYQPCGSGFVIVGSRGGTDVHPAWYLNLLAHPECKLQVGRFAYEATARDLQGEERVRYWGLMTRFWPDYENYQARTERQIPVVILDAVAVVSTS